MANWNWNQEPGAKSWELGSWHAQYTSANINLFMSMCPLLATSPPPHLAGREEGPSAQAHKLFEGEF